MRSRKLMVFMGILFLVLIVSQKLVLHGTKFINVTESQKLALHDTKSKNVERKLSTKKREAYQNVTTPTLATNSNVLCSVMRESSKRSLDTVHPKCFYFDVNKNKATWRGKTVQLECSEYSSSCYTKKLGTLMAELLKTNYEFFYYVEYDHTLCVDMEIIKQLADHYLKNGLQLITTGIGASGWLFTRIWAEQYMKALQQCSKWCYCPDCIAALLAQPRATTRVVLTQHSLISRTGLNTNDKLLPRCFEIRKEYGLNKFDYFDHKKCNQNDISPCKTHNKNLFYGH